MKSLRAAAMLLAAMMLQGCLLNSVKPVTRELDRIPTDRAIVIVGLGFEVDITTTELFREEHPHWNPSTTPTGIVLDRFDPETGYGIGDCRRFDRIQYGALPQTAPVRYAAFNVPAGWYVAGELHSRVYQIAEPPQLTVPFEEHPDIPRERAILHAPGGTVTYFGDWVLTDFEMLGSFMSLGSDWRVNLTGATEFARSLGIPDPQPADRQFVHGARGPMFKCI